MIQSQLFTKARKEAPKDEVSKNAELLIRAGFIHKEMAGVYSFLPLGLRVINKIENIIREEMNALGGQEVFLSALQDKELWEKTDRWNDETVDNWFKTKLKNSQELGLATTHEEPLTAILKNYVNSYRDLPLYIYQFQTKFRNELRSKSGVLRGREFLMKDMYSFSKDEKEHEDFYEKSKIAYKNIFEKVGIGKETYLTFASGGSFSKYSHEFQTLCDSGEDTVFLDERSKIAVNKEVMNDNVLSDLGLNKRNLIEKKSIEVGNIFSLGKRFSEAFNFLFKDKKGKESHVIMGSYGIGLPRLMGSVVEVLSDKDGIVWPDSIAPFDAHLIEVPSSDINVKKRAKRLYEELSKTKDVLYDDRDLRAGEKFAEADLMGIPYQIIVSERGNKDGTVEVKNRSGMRESLSERDLLHRKFLGTTKSG
jgi:prolyl-tRNA synthetase